jgi:FkbM family methyltransferase
LRVQRPGCLNIKGVRILPPPTLFYIPYAFLRLATKWARRPPWLSSFEAFVRTRILRGLRVWTKYLGFKVSMTLEGLVDLNPVPVVFSPTYESAEKELVSHIKPEVAIDVGAHLGSFTLLLARYARVVVAVEPDLRAAGILSSIVSANRLRNVTVFPYACSSSDGGELSLKLERGGGSSIVQGSGGDVTVKTITVDAIVKALQLEKVNFMKVDVEGHELEVLRGAYNTLSRHRPILLVELWPENTKEVEEFLGKLRYSVARVLTKYTKGRVRCENRLYLPQELPLSQLQGPREVHLTALNEVEQGVSKPPRA